MISRALHTISMKILLMVTALTLACTGSVWTRTTNLPHPWLTLDRSAKVLSLQCKPPEEASLNWRAVYDLRLSAFLPQRSVSSNISLVTVTSNMKEPKVNDLFTIHGVTFQGSWPTVSVSLDFLFPVTDKELGRYFCTVYHSDKDDKLSTFTTEIVVNQDFVSSHIHIQPKNVNGFSVKVIEAHEVKVTWTKPESLKFTEASVSRMLVDEEGTPMAPSMSLFTTNGIRQLVYNSDVLLAKFNPQDSGNLSITLYVESDAHSRSYRYTCRMPYPACTGHREVYCMCCQGATNPDTQVCPTPPKDSQIFVVLFTIVLILFLFFLTVVLAVCCVLKTRRSGTVANLLKSFINTDKSTPVGSKEQPKLNSADSEVGASVDGTHKHTSSRLKEAEEGWDEIHKHTSSRLQEAGEASQPQTDLRNDQALATVRQHTTSFSGASTPVGVISDFSIDRTSRGEETPFASGPTDPLIPGDSESSGGKENQQPMRVHLPSEGTSAGKGLKVPHVSLGTVHETLTAHQGEPMRSMSPDNTFHPTQEELGDNSLRPRPRYKSSPATFGEHTND